MLVKLSLDADVYFLSACKVSRQHLPQNLLEHIHLYTYYIRLCDQWRQCVAIAAALSKLQTEHLMDGSLLVALQPHIAMFQYRLPRKSLCLLPLSLTTCTHLEYAVYVAFPASLMLKPKECLVMTSLARIMPVILLLYYLEASRQYARDSHFLVPVSSAKGPVVLR